jgi:uncharacterized protein with HEPN domain
VIAFRNIVLHEYFGIDLELAWAILGGELTRLRQSIESALRQLPEAE